jgi:hypothetical protein
MERMKRADKASPCGRSLTFTATAATFIAVAVIGALSFTPSAGAADRLSVRGAPRAPQAGSCTESCDRKASECLDACDAKFKDDKPRVECKMQCATDRQKCESACPKMGFRLQAPGYRRTRPFPEA